ncbi:MAG: recombinase family protein [Candidatus Paceibacterota bacterium]
MPTYFVYCRKSTEAEDRQILSIDSQINELKQHAIKKGIKIVAVLTEAKSAKAPGRPVFNSLMERLYRGEADGILCWKLDRLARNPVDGGAIIWAMKEHGVKIITPLQTYGQSEDNVVWMYLEFGMAQKYVDDLSRTVKRGLRAKAESGWFPSVTPPGYMNCENDEGRNVIAKDPKRFDIIRKCWDLMLTGKYTPPEIREIANTAWRYTTNHGNPLGRSTIYNIFSNPFYHGTYEYPRGSDNWHTGRHTPMITEEEFDTVQHILSRSRHMPRNRKVFAFTGIIRCGGCQGAVTAEEKHQIICPVCKLKFAYRSKEQCPRCQTAIANMVKPVHLTYTYYHCTKSSNPACTELGVERKELERQIIRHLEGVHLPDFHNHWVNTCFGRLSTKPDTTSMLAVITQSFPNSSPDVQREIVTSIFSAIVLKDREIGVSLKIPFSFPNKAEVPTPLDQKSFTQKTLQEHMSRS